MTRAECGRPVPPDREAQEVLPVVVVVRLAEERKQSRIVARTAVVLGVWVGERIFDVSAARVGIQEVTDVPEQKPSGDFVRLLAYQHGEVVAGGGPGKEKRGAAHPIGGLRFDFVRRVGPPSSRVMRRAAVLGPG